MIDVEHDALLLIERQLAERERKDQHGERDTEHAVQDTIAYGLAKRVHGYGDHPQHAGLRSGELGSLMTKQG